MNWEKEKRIEYMAFYRAKDRCTNPKNKSWKYYGGRGIKFRFASFEEFFRELGPRPKGFVLDRKDNEGHYEKGNVRWATRSESNRNKRYDTKMMKRHQSIAGKLGGSIGGRNQSLKAKALGNHNRWHAARGVTNPECSLCKETM